MKSNLLNCVIVALALLMWYSNSTMFIRLESLMGHSTSGFFSALQIGLALGYSSLTAICVRYLPDLKFVRFFGLFDAVSIVLHWASGIPDSVFSWLGSVYYGCLMYFLVTMIWRLSDMKRVH